MCLTYGEVPWIWSVCVDEEQEACQCPQQETELAIVDTLHVHPVTWPLYHSLASLKSLTVLTLSLYGDPLPTALAAHACPRPCQLLVWVSPAAAARRAVPGRTRSQVGGPWLHTTGPGAGDQSPARSLWGGVLCCCSLGLQPMMQSQRSSSSTIDGPGVTTASCWK